MEVSILCTLASLGAPEHATQALDLARRHGNRYGEIEALLELDDIASAKQALSLAAHDGLRLLEGRALGRLAELHTDGPWETTLDYANQALTIHARTGHRPGIARALLCRARALEGLDRLHEAHIARQQAHDLVTEPSTGR